MKTYVKLFGKSALLVAACVVVGFALLLAAFALPTEPMAENAIASAGVFEEEGTYPTVNFLGVDTMLDNFTDSIMLIQAAYREDASLIDRTINVYRPFGHGVSPVENFASYLETGGTHESGSTYGRYWHGYLVTLKPLLSAFTYGQIRTINAFWVAALALATAFLMHARKLGRYILPFVITLLLIDPFAISMSLFYTSVYTVAMLTSIAFLLKRDWLCERKERLALLFVLAGCATSYLDLMTYPLLAYGILATLCLCSAEGGWKQGLKLVAVTLAHGLWAMRACGPASGSSARCLAARTWACSKPSSCGHLHRLRPAWTSPLSELFCGSWFACVRRRWLRACFMWRLPASVSCSARPAKNWPGWPGRLTSRYACFPFCGTPPYKTILLSILGLHIAYWPYALLRECVCSRGFPQRQTTPGHCARKAHCPHTAAFKPF